MPLSRLHFPGYEGLEESPALKLGIKNWLNIFMAYLTKLSKKL